MESRLTALGGGWGGVAAKLIKKEKRKELTDTDDSVAPGVGRGWRQKRV